VRCTACGTENREDDALAFAGEARAVLEEVGARPWLDRLEADLSPA
jgi:hypothetical protein